MLWVIFEELKNIFLSSGVYEDAGELFEAA